jgi:hypothetical protein
LLAFKSSSLIGQSAIDVSVPETSSTALLFGLGLISLFAFGYKQNARRIAS